MFIHIGGDTMVEVKDIIGIFRLHAKDDIRSIPVLVEAEEQNTIEVVDVGDVKSFIVTDGKVFLSPISSTTLKKRANVLDMTDRIEFH